MRYANYVLDSDYFNTLGDQIQILAIDYIYEKMGIPSEEVIRINKNDLSKYDGEPVILPVSMPLVEYKEHGFAGMFSDKITPLFLGLTMAKDTLQEEEVSYLRRYSPVGCRDERTYRTLQRYGIESYIGGCVTILLPERKTSGRGVKYL